MCFQCCWGCCIFITLTYCSNGITQTNLSSIFWLVIWGLLNTVYFTWIEPDLYDYLYLIIQYFHLIALINIIKFGLVLTSLYKISQIYRSSSNQNRGDLVGINFWVLFLNIFTSSFREGGYEKFIFCLPMFLQIIGSIDSPKYAEEIIGIGIFLVISLGIDYIGIGYALELVKSFCDSCFMLCIGYPLLLTLAAMVCNQVHYLVDNIGNVKQAFNGQYRSNRQMVLVFFKEIGNYLLLITYFIVIYIAEDIIEHYQGFSPILVRIIADCTYCFPLAVMLTYPKNIKDDRFNKKYQEAFNVICIGLTNYMIRGHLK